MRGGRSRIFRSSPPTSSRIGPPVVSGVRRSRTPHELAEGRVLDDRVEHAAVRFAQAEALDAQRLREHVGREIDDNSPNAERLADEGLGVDRHLGQRRIAARSQNQEARQGRGRWFAVADGTWQNLRARASAGRL